MARPHVGDLGYYQAPGSTERVLGMVIGLNGDESVKMHLFGASEPTVTPDCFIEFSVTDDGDIPSAPPPAPPPPAKERARW